MNKVILVGNPNTGKTTLFNTLTGADEHAGNWHGVTVDVKQKKFKFQNEEFCLCDLPGIYSLDAYSKEEKVAVDFINSNRDAVVVCIVDANNLRRNLLLALNLKKVARKLIIAVNMAKEVKGVDYKQLSREFQVEFVCLDARKKKDCNLLKKKVLELFLDANKQQVEVENKKEFSIQSFEAKTRKDFDKIDLMLKNANYKTKGFYGYSKIDKILLNSFFSFFIFAGVMALVFFITFGMVGTWFSELISSGFEFISAKIMKMLEVFIKSQPLLDFISEGIFNGALTVLTFLPQVVLMFICLNILEEVGYLSRVAFMFDRIFKKFGLTGRSVFSLIMGFGCTTSAIMTTRNLDNKKLRERTTLLLPFMSCSAKLPIYAVICSAFFSKHKAIMVFLLYMIAIVLMILTAFILKICNVKPKENYFVLEMPKYRVPSFKKVITGALSSGRSFLVRVGGVLLISSAVVFLLYNFSFRLSYVPLSGDKSILETVAGWLSFLFIPLGLGSSAIVVAIISGIVAKEMVVSSLAIINGVAVSGLAESLISTSSPAYFTTITALSFLVFVLLYPPCLSAMLVMKKELGKKVMIKSLCLQFAVAYVASFLVYALGNLFVKLWWVGLIVVIILAILLFVVIHYLLKRQKKKTLEVCEYTCSLCKEKCYGDNKL